MPAQSHTRKSATIIMGDEMTKEEQKALCEKLRAEAEEALAAMDPTRSYVPGSGYTAWENTWVGTCMSASNSCKKLGKETTATKEWFEKTEWCDKHLEQYNTHSGWMNCDQQPPMATYDTTLPARMQPKKKMKIVFYRKNEKKNIDAYKYSQHISAISE